MKIKSIILAYFFLCFVGGLYSDGRTHSHTAATTNNPELLRNLIANGNSIDSKDEWGKTPLHLASFHGHLECVSILLANGANVNAKDDLRGGSPLHYAALNGHLEVVKLLISKRADINARNKIGGTPLHESAAGGHLEIVKLFITNKIDVNSKDKNNDTPLHDASGEGHLEVVKYLVSKNAKKEIKDNDGKTPLDLAQKNKHQKVIVFFTEGSTTGEQNKLEATKKDGKLVSRNWSEYQGEMDWNNAYTKCASIGMRLPTNDELKTAHTTGVVESWKKDGSDYWSVTAYDENRAYALSVGGGELNSYSREGSFNVRCIR